VQGWGRTAFRFPNPELKLPLLKCPEPIAANQIAEIEALDRADYTEFPDGGTELESSDSKFPLSNSLCLINPGVPRKNVADDARDPGIDSGF
jgi:hypothetical protein